jgi:hypothetical protein
LDSEKAKRIATNYYSACSNPARGTSFLGGAWGLKMTSPLQYITCSGTIKIFYKRLPFEVFFDYDDSLKSAGGGI